MMAVRPMPPMSSVGISLGWVELEGTGQSIRHTPVPEDGLPCRECRVQSRLATTERDGGVIAQRDVSVVETPIARGGKPPKPPPRSLPLHPVRSESSVVSFPILQPSLPAVRALRLYSRPHTPSRGAFFRAAAASELHDPHPPPFDELGLSHDTLERLGGTGRIRQHVNPLKRELQVPTPPPSDWSELFDDPTLPLTLDIGCGSGRFLLLMAKRHANTGNFLGLEIRHALVERATKWAEEIRLTNVAFLLSNATVSLHTLLATYPGPLTLACVQCPDPHFKKRHHKRRVVQPAMIDALAALMPPGGRVFLQSDVEDVATDMRDQFELHGGGRFVLDVALHGVDDARDPAPVRGTVVPRDVKQRGGAGEAGRGEGEADPLEDWESNWARGGWLEVNPLGVPTERELYAQDGGASMCRCMLLRVDE